jgi:hypothetical protein
LSGGDREGDGMGFKRRKGRERKRKEEVNEEKERL